jgi:hypothetical protein
MDDYYYSVENDMIDYTKEENDSKGSVNMNLSTITGV